MAEALTSAPPSRARRASIFEMPLLKRELIGLLRTRRAFWLLVGTVALSLFLSLLGWPGYGPQAYMSSRAREVFLIFSMTQLILAVLVVPAFTAGAISGERERATYELLYSTLLPPFSIVFSKAAAAVGYVVLLLAASAPSVCALTLLGGFDFDAILVSYEMTLLAVISSGVICLTVSMRSRRTSHAAVRGILWVAFWQMGVSALGLLAMALYWEGFRGGMGGPPPGFGLLLSLMPWVAIVSVVEGPPPGISLDDLVLNYRIYATLLIAGHLGYLLWAVRFPDVPAWRLLEAWRGGRADRARARGEAAAGPTRAAGARRRTAFTKWLLGLGIDNPVFEKELRSEFFGRAGFRRSVFWGCVALFLLLTLIENSLDTVIAPVAFIALGAILLLVPATVATSIPREIEQGNIDLLRGTRLSLRSVAIGKALAGMFSFWGVAAAAIVVIVCRVPFVERIRSFSGGRELWDWAIFAVAATLTLLPAVVVFAAGVSIFAAAISRKSMTAMLIAIGAILCLEILVPIVAGEVFRVRYSIQTDSFLIATNPFATLGCCIFDGGNRFGDAAGTLVLSLMFHFGAGIGLVVAAGNVFENLRARDR